MQSKILSPPQKNNDKQIAGKLEEKNKITYSNM